MQEGDLVNKSMLALTGLYVNYDDFLDMDSESHQGLRNIFFYRG